VKALSTRKSGANTNLSFPLSSEKEQRNFASPRRLLFGSSSRTAEHPNLPSPQRLFESSSNTNVANNKSQNEMLPFSTSIDPTPLPLPPPTTKNTSRRSPSPFPFPAENQNVQRPPCYYSPRKKITTVIDDQHLPPVLLILHHFHFPQTKKIIRPIHKRFLSCPTRFNKNL